VGCGSNGGSEHNAKCGGKRKNPGAVGTSEGPNRSDAEAAVDEEVGDMRADEACRVYSFSLFAEGEGAKRIWEQNVITG
jgi:hypothetical protein